MIIAATAVGMDAARTYREVEQRTSNLSLASGMSTPAPAEDFSIRLSHSLSSESITQSTCQSLVSRGSGGCPPLAQNNKSFGTSGEEILSQLAEQAVGQPVTISEIAEDSPQAASPAALPRTPRNGLLPVQRAELISSIVYTQEEKVMFSAQGQVQTADGREISFHLGLSMERRTMVTNSVVTNLTMFIDPLVLRFDTDTALLGDSVFSFDLNSDGEKEQLATLGKGCGFLALDRNHDGIIGNGLELFGPASGEGFGELAGFDSDANQWIDENDPIFNKLLIYKPDGSLQSLSQAGVGAISIAHAGTKFQLEGQNGDILGSVKASGIFLTEAGEVRSLQEVDLASSATTAATASGALPPADNQQEIALQALRDIITMQQFRLKMRLAEQRVQTSTRKVEQRQWLLSWLENHSRLHDIAIKHNPESEGAQDPAGLTAAQRLWPFANATG